MANIREIKEPNGNVFYPLTHERAVKDSNGVSLESKLAGLESKSYVEAWDGASTPVVANIPAGVVVTYNTTTYTGTLAASASTIGKIYLVKNGNDYDRYFTSQSGNTYSWVPNGSTEMNLSGYATDAELGELEHKVTGLENLSLEVGGINGTTGKKSVASTRARCTAFIDNTTPVTIRVSGSLNILNYNLYNLEDYTDFVSQESTDNTQLKGGEFRTGKYLVLVFRRTDNGDITETDLQTEVSVTGNGLKQEIQESNDNIGTELGGVPIGEVHVGGINATTGWVSPSTTSRLYSSFIDGRNKNISVSCTGNIIIYLVVKYNAIGGTPTGDVVINATSRVFDKESYGCYLRFVFKRTDNTDCAESDAQFITITSSGFSSAMSRISNDVSLIKENDTPYPRPWDAIEEHQGILLSTEMAVAGFAGNTHKVIPVNGGETLTVKANDSYIARFALVKTYTPPTSSNRSSFDFATGEDERRNVDIGTMGTFTIPTDARFVVVSSLMGSADANAEPSSLLIDGYSVISGMRKDIGDLKAETRALREMLSANIVFEQGGVNDNTGATTSATTRVRTSYIEGAFLIQLNDGYLINQIYKWSKAGSYIGAVEEDVPIGSSYEMEDSGYMYRVVMRKADNTDLLPTDDIVSVLSVGMEYEYGRNIYGFTRASLAAEVEGRIVPYVRGTDEDRMSYDTSKEYERLVIGFMTDNHIDLGDKQASYNNVKDAIDFYNRLHIPVAAILEGGDAITKIVNTKALQIAHLERFFDMTWKAKMPCLFTKGNHDINTINVPPSLVLDDDDWGDIWFNRAESQYGIVRQTKASGKKSGYYYYDLDAWKVRIICVDCFDLDYTKVNGSGNVLYSGGAANWIANEQYNWIANTALNFDDKAEKDWGVIVFTHFYRTYDEYGTDIEPKFANPYRKFNEMLVAFNSQTDYSEVYNFQDNTFFNLNVSANFSRYANLEKKPYFISLITGHRHFDGNEVLDGINNILTANQLCGENSADIRLKRVAHTKTQNLFDTFVIDLKARTIRAFRFGAGVTCYGNGGDRFLPNGLSF